MKKQLSNTPYIRAQRFYLALMIMLSISISSAAEAADRVKLPPVNLGNTAFMDGMAGPGTLLQLSANMSKSDSFQDHNGNPLPGNNQIDVMVYTLQLAHITRTRLWDGFYGVEVLLPFVDIKPDTSLPGLPDLGESGVADIIFSPFMLQWTNSELFGKPYFHRLNLIFTLPTGDYSATNDVNPGVNLVKFNPYYAGTLQLTPKLSTSFRLHYLWNGKNTDPNPLLNADSIQPGTATHLNFAMSYAVLPDLRLGLAGYYLSQLSEDRIDGVRQQDSKESVSSIGPGLHYRNGDEFFNLNSYYEFNAHNRAEGYRILARYAWLWR